MSEKYCKLSMSKGTCDLPQQSWWSSRAPYLKEFTTIHCWCRLETLESCLSQGLIALPPQALEPAWPLLYIALPCSGSCYQVLLDEGSDLPPGFLVSLQAPLHPFSPCCSQSHSSQWKSDSVARLLRLLLAQNLALAQEKRPKSPA